MTEGVWLELQKQPNRVQLLKRFFFRSIKVTSEINQIAVASERKTAATDEIAANIQQISIAMQETAARIQDNARASANSLENLSKKLQGVVGQFISTYF